MNFATGKGTKRTGKRVLAVGTDCSVGKKYTALALDEEMRKRLASLNPAASIAGLKRLSVSAYLKGELK